MSPTRREFLKLSAFAAAALSVPSLDVLSVGQKKLERRGAAKKIIIVGAGLAGLSAADEIAQAGDEGTVFGARVRPRGRAFSDPAPFPGVLVGLARAGRTP